MRHAGKLCRLLLAVLVMTLLSSCMNEGSQKEKEFTGHFGIQWETLPKELEDLATSHTEDLLSHIQTGAYGAFNLQNLCILKPVRLRERTEEGEAVLQDYWYLPVVSDGRCLCTVYITTGEGDPMLSYGTFLAKEISAHLDDDRDRVIYIQNSQDGTAPVITMEETGTSHSSESALWLDLSQK